MCSNGTVSEAWTWSATLCMVLVHSSTMSAPADSRPRAASASSAAAASQLPARCMAAIPAKSTEYSTQCAEWSPPSRSRTVSFASR